MKLKCILFVSFLLCSMFLCILTYATGEGNIDGGGGDLGSGSGGNVWNSGNEGVRVSVIRNDGTPVTTPIDITNKRPNVLIHFGKHSKVSYSSSTLLINSGTYNYKTPAQPLPRIISTSNGNGNISSIKNYFTDELIIRYIASATNINYDTLIGGQFKILIEPVAYLTYNGIKMAMTATEAALYDQQVGGKLRTAMGNLTHKNLPLAIFLEVGDLGYPAWSGTRSGFVANEDIKSSLGIGVVRFSEPTPPPEISAFDYEYRINTEVVTSVSVSGGQSDPDNPVHVSFNIGGQTYNVGNVFYPSDDSQLAWVRWTTPDTPQTVNIDVTVSGGGDFVNIGLHESSK